MDTFSKTSGRATIPAPASQVSLDAGRKFLALAGRNKSKCGYNEKLGVDGNPTRNASHRMPRGRLPPMPTITLRFSNILPAGRLILPLLFLLTTVQAQDPDIMRQLNRLPKAVSAADRKTLGAVANFLQRTTPAALDSGGGELNSPQQIQDPLPLSKEQRKQLKAVYDTHVKRIVSAMKLEPFDEDAGRQVGAAAAALRSYIKALEELGKLDPTSTEYRDGINRVIAGGK